MRTAVGFNLLYLTLQQFDLFYNIKKAVVRAPAGCGKTVLVLLRILQLVADKTADKILLIGPWPHVLRCKMFLESNGLSVLLAKLVPASFASVPELRILPWDARDSSWRPIGMNVN